MADTARGIPRMSSGTKGKSPGASDDGESSARARAPPDVVPKLAKMIAKEATKKQWLHYGENGRKSKRSIKQLMKQQRLIREVHKMQENMAFSKKTIAAAVKIALSMATFKLNAKMEESWEEGITLRLFTMFTHVNMALSRPTKAKWLIALLGCPDPKEKDEKVKQKKKPEGKKPDKTTMPKKDSMYEM